MTTEQKQQLVSCLEGWLLDLDRHAGCSDLFFRQVYSQRARGFLSTGLLDVLKAEIAAEQGQKAAKVTNKKKEDKAV